MSKLVDLLPHTTTDLEIAVVEVMDSRSRIRERARRIIDARHDNMIDPIILPWLLRDWGLEDAAAFTDDWQRLYREGKGWQRVRGTWEALDIARAWAGFPDALEEELQPGGVRWAEYQIALGRAPETLAPIGNIIGLARLSTGAKSILTRAFHGFDVRAMRLDHGRLDETLLDADSGVRLRPDWPILSLGRRYVDEVDSSHLRGASDALAISRTIGIARYVDDVMLDWCDPAWTRARTVSEIVTGSISNLVSLDRSPEEQPLRIYRTVKAGIICDQQWPSDDVNFVFPPYRVEARGNPWLADGFRLDRDTEYRERVEIIDLMLGRALDEATIPASSALTASRTVQGFAFELRPDVTANGGSAVGQSLEANYSGQQWLNLPWPDEDTWDSYRNPVSFYGNSSE